MTAEPENRPGLGDYPGRIIRDGEGRGYIEWRWTPDYGVEIVNIEILGTHRRTGVGRLLLRQLVDLVRAQGAKCIWAVTRSGNRIAHDWYRAMGFYENRLHGFYDPRLLDPARHGTTGPNLVRGAWDATLFVRSTDDPVK